MGMEGGREEVARRRKHLLETGFEHIAACSSAASAISPRHRGRVEDSPVCSFFC